MKNADNRTYGQKLLNVDPNATDEASQCGLAFADMIDRLNSIAENAQSSFKKKECKLAIGSLLSSHDLAVSAITCN